MDEVQWQTLADAAKAVCRNAYSAYSGFPVGAAVLTERGTIANGCNVENASYGLTICAERNAIFHAVAEGARAIVALALYTPTSEPVAPCGACRQVLAEFGADAIVRAYCDGARIAEFTLRELLPQAFSLDREY
ncbi:MAG TPA: cytidine deaminase [Casimicrobiaceae bacterium]|nr:cytidine deaminase [Casimicrobiaceae bacterium]